MHFSFNKINESIKFIYNKKPVNVYYFCYRFNRRQAFDKNIKRDDTVICRSLIFNGCITAKKIIFTIETYIL